MTNKLEAVLSATYLINTIKAIKSFLFAYAVHQKRLRDQSVSEIGSEFKKLFPSGHEGSDNFFWNLLHDKDTPKAIKAFMKKIEEKDTLTFFELARWIVRDEVCYKTLLNFFPNTPSHQDAHLSTSVSSDSERKCFLKKLFKETPFSDYRFFIISYTDGETCVQEVSRPIHRLKKDVLPTSGMIPEELPSLPVPLKMNEVVYVIASKVDGERCFEERVSD